MRKPILLVCTLVCFFYACTKIRSTDIGTGLIPAVDGVTTKDTFINLLVSNNIDEDQARVYKTDDHVIGVINNDPLFGKTLASAYFELKPTAYPYSFPGDRDSLIADSAVLVLSYKGTYGDASATSPEQTWRVFEIDQNHKLKYDSSYPAQNAVIRHNAIALGSKVINVATVGKDSLKDRFERSGNQIRIKLDNGFANRFIKQFDSSITSANNAYSTDSAFRKQFGGFAVVPDAGSGNALIRVNLLDTNTRLSLYYSSVAIGAKVRDTGVRNFVFAYSNASTSATSTLPLVSGNANSIIRDRTNAQVSSYLNSAPNKKDSLVFIQTSPGTYARIAFPDAMVLPSNSIIHRADLLMEQVPDNSLLDQYMAPPRYLLLTAWDSAGKRKINVHNDYIVDPQSGANISSFGGFLIYKDAGAYGRIASYNFNLTRYIQGVVTRRDTLLGLRLNAPSNDSLSYRAPYPSPIFYQSYYISPSSGNVIAHGRVRLAGGSTANNTSLRMRLRIIYSLL